MLQFGFVFGIAHLAAMIFAPFFAATSPKIGAKNVFVVGSLLQSLFGGLLFAFLVRFLLFLFPMRIFFLLQDKVNDTTTFLSLSYSFRQVKF